MRKAPYLSALSSNSTSSRGQGFTLVELLVSIAILALIMVVLAQFLQETGLTIGKTSRSMETTELCLAALDRIDSNLSSMITTGPATMVVVKNTTGVNDGLALVTNERVRSQGSSSGPINVANSSDIRMAAMGYCVGNAVDPDLAGAPSVPMLEWGNGTVTWNSSQIANGNSINNLPLSALSAAVTDVSSVVTNGGTLPSPAKMLQFQPLSHGICRLEICFLLSNGTLISVTAPPLNKNFLSSASPSPAATFTAPNYALAFNANDSNSSTGLYVRALIIGVAAIDSVTQKTLTAAQLASLPSALAKTIDGQTPLQAWDISSGSTTTYVNLKAYPTQVLQNIRFFQRYFYVN